MARFTFGVGNARKLLRLPLYALGALATLVVPRTDRLWVFGSGIGLGEGALPLYRAARERLDDGTRLVWLATTDAELAEAQDLGLDAAPKSGWRGFRLTLRARVLVVTHGFGDVNRFATRGGFVVQLWHGIPLKRLHLDSPATLRVSFLPDHRLVRAVVARAYRAAGRGIRLFPVASELVAARISSAFGVPRDRIVVTGDPRDDALTTPAAPLLEAGGSRTILYAPTWRDGDPDPATPTPEQWRALAAWLDARDAVLYVRAHPLGAGDYAAGPALSDRIRMLGSDRVRDVNAVLPEIDVLVTDYSSIAFDFALLDRPIVFLAADLEPYAKRRGLYDAYREFSGGRHTTGWEGALELLGTALDGDPAALRHSAWLRDEYVDVSGGATGRVLDEILARTRGADAPAVAVRERPIVAIQSTDGPRVRLTISGPVTAARLEGRRARVEGILSPLGDLTVAEFDLLAPRWGAIDLALPSDGYRLQLATDEGWSSRTVMTGSTVLDHELFRATIESRAGGVVVAVAPPLTVDERGPVAQRRLEQEYRHSRPAPEDAVFLESFYGQSASCNPLGIDRALAALRPGITRYWSVVDGSVAVPDGAVRLIEGSREWWRVRASARALVVNDWVRKRYRRRRHQKVLQTWHGTMLKKLALDRKVGFRTRIAVTRERDRWDALLAQNPYSAEIFRSAYAMRKPIWQEGYPRNDVLHDPERAAAVRAAIGIPADARVVLYAPTWRDDRTEMVDFVDLAAFARDLADSDGSSGFVVLARGHSRTLAHGKDLLGENLVDVTSYPDMADLLLVADVLVTDYSSVMFDFAGTGRPIVFFTPDLSHYSTDLRGFYFDLLESAPGPVVTTRDELREAILAAADGQPPYAARRAAWRERFTPRDDGAAGQRVVERMLAEGWLP
ncbi:CDP-glycerol glycerophosphotransferase family protein [Pseudolysinimonas sp.]|jgi:CDP-glycerol glycerophosphotransferase|uniref:CDP-glycerol glycerophosphotransferase family protein n=1 Tax=Pseudolysinimonas sp. TaxID=2680009 RepID=UPI003784941A